MIWYMEAYKSCMQPLPHEWHHTSLDKTDFWRHNYPLLLLSHKILIILQSKDADMACLSDSDFYVC